MGGGGTDPGKVAQREDGVLEGNALGFAFGDQGGGLGAVESDVDEGLLRDFAGDTGKGVRALNEVSASTKRV